MKSERSGQRHFPLKVHKEGKIREPKYIYPFPSENWAECENGYGRGTWRAGEGTAWGWGGKGRDMGGKGWVGRKGDGGG